MKLLMHTCCAPCSISCVDSLRAEGIEPVLYFFNPNIHPYTEYKARRDALQKHAADNSLELIIEDYYGLRSFIRGVPADFENRCAYCYTTRLSQSAKFAAQNGFDAFTATLLVSPYQNHSLLVETAEKAAEKYGVKFLYRDFRPGFREGQRRARESGLYMQKYCGCIFSEEERYLNKSK